MPYGLRTYNSRGSVVFDTERPVACIADSTTINARGRSNYLNNTYWCSQAFNEKYSYFGFELDSGIRQVAFNSGQMTDNTNTTTFAGAQYNWESDIGPRPFDAIDLSSRIPKNTGGYGLELRNELGQVFYRYDEKVLKVEPAVFCKYKNFFTLPGNCWVIPIWCDDNSGTSRISRPLIERQGNSNQWYLKLDGNPISGEGDLKVILVPYFK